MNSKYALKYTVYFFYSFVILLSIYLSSSELAQSWNIRNSIMFFTISLTVYFIRIVLLSNELLKFPKLTLLEESNFKSKYFVFNVIFIPILNICLIFIYGLVNISLFSLMVTSIIFTFSLVSLFDFVATSSKNLLNEELRIDVAKITFLYLFTVVVSSFLKTDLPIIYLFIIYLNAFIGFTLIQVVVSFFQSGLSRRNLLRSFFMSYIITITIILINFLFKNVSEAIIGMYLILFFYVLNLFSNSDKDNKELRVWARYFIMIILATLILILAN